MRAPPKPVTTAPGSSFRISAATAPAYRSPEGSPHESITRRRCNGKRLARLLEDARGERDVELDRAHVTLDAGAPGPAHHRMKRNLHAVDVAVVGEALLDALPLVAH